MTKATKKTASKPAKASEKAELTGRAVRLLTVLNKSSKPLTADDLRKATDIMKGLKLKQLFERGLIKTEQPEGERKYLHTITKAGKAALDRAAAAKAAKAKAAKAK